MRGARLLLRARDFLGFVEPRLRAADRLIAWRNAFREHCPKQRVAIDPPMAVRP